MPIAVQCAGCGAKFRSPDELAGKSVKCPKCATQIQVGNLVQQPVVDASIHTERPAPGLALRSPGAPACDEKISATTVSDQPIPLHKSLGSWLWFASVAVVAIVVIAIATWASKQPRMSGGGVIDANWEAFRYQMLFLVVQLTVLIVALATFRAALWSQLLVAGLILLLSGWVAQAVLPLCLNLGYTFYGMTRFVFWPGEFLMFLGIVSFPVAQQSGKRVVHGFRSTDIPAAPTFRRTNPVLVALILVVTINVYWLFVSFRQACKTCAVAGLGVRECRMGGVAAKA